MTKRKEMDVDDFIFMAFMCGAKLIYKQLRDKRLTANRYVADRRWFWEKDPEKYKDSQNDVTCWFHVSYGKKNSIGLDKWVEDCEKMGLRWELRQSGKNHYTVFLMMNESWYYDKQIRSYDAEIRYNPITKLYASVDNNLNKSYPITHLFEITSEEKPYSVFKEVFDEQQKHI
jgi:hypothetical protein